MNKLQFSVLICVYEFDNPLFFKQAFSSILDQNITPSEIILVIDGPISKQTEDVVNHFISIEDRLLVIKLKKNVGHGKAKNIGLDRCSYDLVAIMDSDDICVKDRFEKQLLYFRDNPLTSILGGVISEFKDDVNLSYGKRVLPESHLEISSYLKNRCPMNHMTVMFRKSEVIKAGGYLDWHYNEDYYLWIRMYLSGSIFANLNDVIVHARVNEKFYLRRGGIKYFLSESKLQYYMFKKDIISIFRLVLNIKIRLFVQVLLPNRIRSWMFLKFFRDK